jgi:hypothetical protein
MSGGEMSRLKEFEEFAKHQRHANASETEFWCGQFQLKARQYAEEIDRLTEALQTARQEVARWEDAYSKQAVLRTAGEIKE